MRLDFFILADEAAAGENQKINIRGGGLTHVEVPGFSAKLSALAMASRVVLEPSDVGDIHQVAIRVLLPDGRPQLEINGQLRVGPSELKTHRGEDPSIFLVGTLKDHPLPLKGRYSFEFVLDGDVVDTKTIAVVVAESGAPAPAPESKNPPEALPDPRTKGGRKFR
jgi:hypothetical protein